MSFFEEQGWPEALMRWRQTHIPKDEADVPDLGRLRPIAIASVVVRAWNRVRAAQLAAWVKPAVPACAAGGVPGRSAEMVLEPLLPVSYTHLTLPTICSV
eukprot:13339810-Alexandrium_andersonii.AAC.1